MNKSSSELKSMAKGQLMGHYALPMGTFVLVEGITFFIYFILAIAFPNINYMSLILHLISITIVCLLSMVFSTGLSRLFLNMSRNKPAGVGDLLYGFSNHPDRIILASLLLGLIFIACYLPAFILMILGAVLNLLILLVFSIFFMIAGSVVAFILMISYSQVYFLYLDNPEKGVMELLRESRELMYGNKGRYFYINISFIGLVLLSVFTCYIGLLWLIPYFNMTQTFFYRDLINEL